MSEGQPLKVVRADLACEDEAEFLRKLAPVIGTKGFFMPSAVPSPIGSHLLVQLKLRKGAVTGEATVVRHGQQRQQPGMLLKFIRLDEGSVQFPLTPAEPAQVKLPTAPGSEADFDQVTRSLRAPAAPPPRRFEVTKPVEAARPLSSTVVAPPQPEKLADLMGTVAKEPDRELLKETERREQQGQTGLQTFDLLGSYQLLCSLGGGGMAEVYLARSTLGEGVEKLVAFKTVRPQFGPDTPMGMLFLNEARISVTLQHPNIVQVFDFGEARGRPYLAMEYVHGRTLSDVLARFRELNRPPPTSLAVAVAVKVCDALEYLHTKQDLEGTPLGLVHRDVTPTNILISTAGEVKLLDFGVAAAADTAETHELVVGKYAYMAPEQARGEAPSPTWDVYALGVVLHQLLTLDELGIANSGASERAAQVDPGSRLPASTTNSEVTAGLDRALMGATDLDPGRRLQSARELRALLQAAQEDLMPVDLPSEMQELFGAELARERGERQALLVQARALAPTGGGTGVFGKALKALRRKVLTSAVGTHLSRYPRVMKTLSAALVLAVGAGGYFGWTLAQAESHYSRELVLADERLASGLLVGPGGDTAVDHLVAARKLRPEDGRALARLQLLAARFEELGDAAMARGDEAEAAVHFQASLLAEPGRGSATTKLKSAEESVRARSAQQTKRTP